MSDLEMTMYPEVKVRAGALLARRAGCVAALCLLAGACSTLPQRPLAGPDPADPSARVPSATYRPALSGYASQRPVEPAPWRRQNERVAPTQKQ